MSSIASLKAAELTLQAAVGRYLL